ncbi:MAG: HIT family protein [Acidimicrobiia bacterium]
MTLERLWAGWRGEYVAGASATDSDAPEGCVFCRILASGEADEKTYVLRRGELCFAILNAFPYTSGHLVVMPFRHVGDLEDLSAEEASEMWATVTQGVAALKRAYRPDGVNVGINLGRAAGAGVPGHVHVHVIPRWNGDASFMTAAAEARVLPEALPATWEKLTKAWEQ